MSWKEIMKEIGGCDVAFLTVDGEVLTFLVCSDPVLIEGKFKGKQTKRLAFVIVTLEGVTVFVVGMRVARKLSKFEDYFGSHAFEVIRHGEQNDQDTTYNVTRIDNDETFKALQVIQVRDFDPDMIDELMAEVEDVIKG